MFNADKIKTTIDELCKYKEKCLQKNLPAMYVECGFKQNNDIPESGWCEMHNGHIKTTPNMHFWCRMLATTPEKQDGKKLFLRFSTGSKWAAGNPQGIVYFNGKMIQGIDANHCEVNIPWSQTIEIAVYMYIGAPTDLYFQTDLVMSDVQIEKLWYDIKVPYESAILLGDTEDYHTIIHKLLGACNLLRFQTAEEENSEFSESVAAADEYLEREFYGKDCNPEKTPVVNCIGHTHIDVAWLWTYKQTIEKAQRSFSSMCRLLDEYPEFIFMSSQPQLYEYVKEQAPEIYEQIKSYIKDKRWEAEGAMWLEADCNLTSGESLVRQIVFGKRFMKNEFGIDSKILWLPDVFGYSSALPQILKKCGVEFFMTSKISWNETNKMPHSKFYWKGIDGSEIFTALLPMAYNGKLTTSEIRGCYVKNADKDFGSTTFTTVGFGDGGGGTTREMIETQRRLNKGIPGMPRTKFTTAYECFCQIKKEFDDNAAELNYSPKWTGELYLELHRGTYTSVGENKRNNRLGEFALLRAESLSVLDMLNGGEYDSERINKAWKTLLLNQFHDVLPGSSIKEVYNDSRNMYRELMSDIQALQSEKMHILSNNLSSDGGFLVYNPTGFTADGTICCDEGTAVIKNLPPFTLTVVNPSVSGGVAVSKGKIENRYFKVLMNENGEISSLYDKRCNREALKGTGNVITAYENIPRCWDNWEISDYYVQKPTHVCNIVSSDIIEDGDRAGIKTVKKYYNSVIIQTVWLYNEIDRIDFETEIDWHEKHQILKVNFPVNVNANRATYETQFGNIERPTHTNTSWDAAKFEVCGHKWADVSDNGYGVSLMNDCKYGYSCNGTDLALTLLKSGSWPQLSDQGLHYMTYSLYPHQFGYAAADTVKRAYLLNQPFVYEKVGKLTGNKKSMSLVACDSDNIVIETVKRAEDNNNIVVRLYESRNSAVKTVITPSFNFKAVWICDMLENKKEEIPVINNSVSLNIANFEIITLLFEI